MKRFLILAFAIALICPCLRPAWATNPFTSKQKTHQKAPKLLFKSQIFVKIIFWQHQLKQKMSDLIRDVRKERSLKPILFLMAIAFLYGVIHAAGPGHGKVVAMSYILSHQSSLIGGVLFGVGIALIHGFSGIIGVFGLRYLIQRSVSDTLSSVTDVTQIVSFGLITLLGLGILIKHIYELAAKSETEKKKPEEKTTPKTMLPWAAAVGLVPCPAVVMVMLFCLSMEVMILGLCLSMCIALGMACTVSIVVVAVILGKAGLFSIIPEKRVQMIETCVGLLSGAAIAVLGTVFLISSINSVLY